MIIMIGLNILNKMEKIEASILHNNEGDARDESPKRILE